MSAWVHVPWVSGALTGLMSAAAIDFRAFQSWKSFHEAAIYDWQTAGWRWLQGAVVGAMSGLGLGWM